MVRQDLLAEARQTIQDTIGGLDDLPDELANTVANVVYRFCRVKAGFLTPGIPTGGENPYHDMEKLIEDVGSLTSKFDLLPQLIQNFRQIDKTQQPKLHQYTVDYLLDILKYDIPDANKKSGMRRIIERRFRRKAVIEVPNLHKTLNF